MKKNIILAFILLLFPFILVAGPAYPGRITYTQPDGTTIGIHIHGDEFGHWVTDDSGNVLTQDEDGYWRRSSTMTSLSLNELKQKAAVRRTAASKARKAYAQSSTSANFGSPKIPVILVGFKDKAFSKTNAQFTALLNEAGYSDNDGVGSVLDYYTDNSLGQFTPQFEVLGPVTLDNKMSYYGANNSDGDDVLPEMALVHAAQKLDSSVDFSRYDNDGDGTVDFIMFYFAGYDEAQGGSTSCIWSHAWYLSSSSNAYNNRTFDGVKLDRYFCTAELKNSSGSTMCSIGTTCHEFAHTLGLPDFYDTDYDGNGQAAEMYDFDLMSNGAYNGDSTTPPYFTAEELYEVGWLSTIPELTTSGPMTLPAVNHPGATAYSAYMSKTSVDGEYFVYEVRGGQGWDAPLPTGMLVYHVDKSTNRVYGSITAESTWDDNAVNCYSSHPCCYVVPAGNPTSTAYYSGTSASFMFPGSKAVTSYAPTAWSGETTGFQLTNISYADQTVSFNLVNSNDTGISGTVMNSDGNPLSGATVTITETSSASSSPARVGKLFRPSSKRLAAMQKAAVASVVTDSDGNYSVELEAGTYLVTASKEGYVSQSASVTVSSLIESKSFRLLREGEEAPSVLYAWPADVLTDEDAYIVGAESRSLIGQNLYPSSEIGCYAGKQIKAITFYLYGDSSTTYNGVYAIIDYESDRQATVAVSSDDLTIGGYTTVDLTDLDLLIPSDKDIYAGVGFSRGGYYESGYYYAFSSYYKSDEDGNTYDWAVGWPYDGFVADYNLTSTGTRTSWDAVFEFTLTIGDYETPDIGYNHIADPGNGVYAAGDSFSLELVETEGTRKPDSAIAWYLDDEAVSGTSVVLTAGTHVIEARFTTTDGNTKVVELELRAE